jgi:predicted DNA-binding transcriptional regulator YafY
VALTPPPLELEKSLQPTAEQLEALPKITRDARDTLERCITAHHVAAIDYTDAKEHRATIRIEPGYIRFNVAKHLVVRGIRDGKWEEFRFDRIHAVQDTGDVFEPSW